MTPRSLLAPAKLGGQPILRAQTDERLVQLSQDGSRVAFEAIVARYRRQLVSYCARFLGQGRAEDAVQQTFEKALTALTAGERVRNLRPWLYRIAHNTSLNMLRDRGLQHEQLSEEIDGVERPDQAAERRQELAQVLQAVQALPARQRDVIVLRAIEGRTYEQIAGELGLSHGAVRQLLSRARCGVRAGVAAVTPFGLLARIAAPLGDAPTAVLAGGASGSGTFATGKIFAAAVAAAVAGGGVTGLPEKKEQQAGGPRKAVATVAAQAPAKARATASLTSGTSPSSRSISSTQTRTGSGSRRTESPATDRSRATQRNRSTGESGRHHTAPNHRPRRESRDRPPEGRPQPVEGRRARPDQPAPTYPPPDASQDPTRMASTPPPRVDGPYATGTQTQPAGMRDGAFRDGAR